MSRTAVVTLSLIVLMLLFSCKKDEPQSVIPEITFLSISPAVVQQFSDSLVIKLKYIDGDGDLGENLTNEPNAFVTDLRNNLEYSFRIRQLAPDNANIIITGQLEIVVPAVSLSGSTAEQASFSAYIKDRAGNKSNTVTTSAVTVTP